MSLAWTLRCGSEGVPPQLGESANVGTPAAALAVFDRIERAVAKGDFLVRVQDARSDAKFLDVAACEWGWALVWNDSESSIGDSFGTLGDGESETRPFAPPGGEDLEFDRAWFVKESKGRLAVEAYVRTGKLWRGVRWWPAPPAELLVD